MLNLKKVAVTGGLSCGKSSVCQFFEQLGAYVVSADRIVHELLTPRSSVGKRVIEMLGPTVVKDDAIDRAEVAKQVFEDTQRLRALEELLHPAVHAVIGAEYRRISELGSHPLFVAEVPLLYEAQLQDGFDAIVAVVSDAELCAKRYEAAGRGDGAAFQRRARLQLAPAEKAARADYVIANNGNLNNLFQATKTVYDQLVAA